MMVPGEIAPDDYQYEWGTILYGIDYGWNLLLNGDGWAVRWKKVSNRPFPRLCAPYRGRRLMKKAHCRVAWKAWKYQNADIIVSAKIYKVFLNGVVRYFANAKSALNYLEQYHFWIAREREQQEEQFAKRIRYQEQIAACGPMSYTPPAFW